MFRDALDVLDITPLLDKSCLRKLKMINLHLHDSACPHRRRKSCGSVCSTPTKSFMCHPSLKRLLLRNACYFEQTVQSSNCIPATNLSQHCHLQLLLHPCLCLWNCTTRLIACPIVLGPEKPARRASAAISYEGKDPSILTSVDYPLLGRLYHGLICSE